MKNTTRQAVITFLSKFEKKYETGSNESDDALIHKVLFYANEMASVFEAEPAIIFEKNSEKQPAGAIH
jgi:hypothetical protein